MPQPLVFNPIYGEWDSGPPIPSRGGGARRVRTKGPSTWRAGSGRNTTTASRTLESAAAGEGSGGRGSAGVSSSRKRQPKAAAPVIAPRSGRSEQRKRHPPPFLSKIDGGGSAGFRWLRRQRPVSIEGKRRWVSGLDFGLYVWAGSRGYNNTACQFAEEKEEVKFAGSSYMPTPVTAARQCLTEDSAAALGDAASVARRRGHPQTTSLHMVASLLALPNSSLREACTRAQNSAYTTRVQFKALELSLGAALDRFPSSKAARADAPPPPVSNSLMAAIKRSQANQRRQPEGFGFYPSSSSSSIPVVKVELQNLTLSILDDPLVSRVLGDAGFRSCDVKIATISKKINNNNNKFQPQYLYGYYYSSSRYNRHNRYRNPPLFLCHSKSYNYSLPFMGCDNENSRKIGEVMLRNKKRNPLLLGASAIGALRTFLKSLESKTEGAFSVGLSVVCVEDEVSRFVSGDCDNDGPLKSKFEEVGKLVGGFSGQGVVLSLGDFKVFFGDGVCLESLRYLVGKLGRLLEDGKVWLIGAADNYEVYFQILNKFPSVEEEWDMGLLPINSLGFSTGASYPRSRSQRVGCDDKNYSLMESFVPLGGFFSMPSETKGSMSSASCQYVARCHLCNEKCNQEVSALSNDGLYSPVAEPGFAAIKAKDDDDGSLSLNATIAGVHQKWDTICQHQHHHINPPPFQENTSTHSSSSTHFQPSPSLQEPQSSDQMSYKPNHPIISSPNSVISVSTDLNLGPVSSSSTGEDLIHDLSGPPSAKCHDNLYRVLVERVGRQEEAISSVVEAITQSQTTSRFKNGDHIWINLSGADRLGKKKLGLALAEILYGTTESFVYVDLSFSDEITTHADNNNNNKLSNKYDLTMRGTVVDYLVEKLSVNPRVIFLENVDKSDHVVQNRLTRALKTGRLTDLRGREVNVSNSIFIATTSVLESGEGKFSEENVLKAEGRPIRICVGFDLNNDPGVENVNRSSDLGLMNKRKRGHVAPVSYLDLNLPAQTSEKMWIDDFDRQIDRVVVFKPLDFDKLGEKLFEVMSECLHESVGSKCMLEIEFRVMRQIIAAAYIFGDKSVEDWILCILKKGFSEAMGKFGIDVCSVVKLVSCDEEIEGHLLPGRIMIN
ncbi:hypothetical protein PHJA_001909000 [Phtheirospermum japonicum]|uniref:Clp R domain-containing protein n=1 Tax=Phtheirospermum japonicum TaxID=374723 RepID=A0A830CF17_9LAMI|nr:hypothetical protein PHJA_001909000 [Phtheirospermum japonicum]